MRNRVYHDKRTGWWVADYCDAHGGRHRERVARTKTLALQVLHKRLDDVALETSGHKPALADITFEQLAERFKAWASTHKRPKTAIRYRSSIGVLLPHFGKLPLSGVTQEAVERFVTKRRADRFSPATANRDVACLKRMFSKAVEWELAVESPLRKVKLLRENNARVRYLSDEERKALLEACQGRLLDIVTIALYTGMRRNEILHLKWQDVELGRRQITVRDTKNGETRHVPISVPLLTRLRSLPRRAGQSYLFANHDGTPFQSITTAWDNAAERANLKDFRFHDLRHTFASYFMMSVGDINALREILGHKTLAMTIRYSHLAPAHLRSAVDQMAKKVAEGTILPKEEGTQGAQEKRAV